MPILDEQEASGTLKKLKQIANDMRDEEKNVSSLCNDVKNWYLAASKTLTNTYDTFEIAIDMDIDDDEDREKTMGQALYLIQEKFDVLREQLTEILDKLNKTVNKNVNHKLSDMATSDIAEYHIQLKSKNKK